MTVECEESTPKQRPIRQFFTGLRDARRALRAQSARAASIETSNDIFNEVLCRSVADLYMLMTDKPQGAIPYAGIPWYSTAFGRDAIITATEMLWMDPSVATGVLRFLASTQAKEIRKDAEAEPGKIVHEMRSGEMARLGEVPFAFYYGSVDSTPLFVVLAGLYFERTQDLALVSELWPNIEAALNWIDAYGDRDGDGFVEYQGGETGLTNQGWKDSADSIFHADGSDPVGPIALCEVQGYVYAAKRLGAKMAAANGLAKRADELDREAEDLRVRFEEAFWCDDIGTYALALDGRKRPCRVRSSNAGQLLFTGIVAKERAAAVARAAAGPELLHRLGDPDDRLLRSALQPDVLPQRLGLAARQRADRPRLCALWIETGSSAASGGSLQHLALHGLAPAAGIVLRLQAHPRQRANSLSGGLLSAGLGERCAAGSVASLSWPRV